MTESLDGASVTSSGLRKSSTASSILDGTSNANNLASPSSSAYSASNSPDSTDSGGLTTIGHGSQPKTPKLKKSQSVGAVASSASRGPPGSCKCFRPGNGYDL